LRQPHLFHSVILASVSRAYIPTTLGAYSVLSITVARRVA